MNCDNSFRVEFDSLWHECCTKQTNKQKKRLKDWASRRYNNFQFLISIEWHINYDYSTIHWESFSRVYAFYAMVNLSIICFYHNMVFFPLYQNVSYIYVCFIRWVQLVCWWKNRNADFWMQYHTANLIQLHNEPCNFYYSFTSPGYFSRD